MNTCSVSFNKSIPESSAIESKSKGNKSEDSFKDMIKNVSSNKPPDTSNQATKEEKDLEGTNLTGAQDEDVAEKKEDNASISDLASLVGKSPNILDSVQLTKVVNLSAGNLSTEGQVEAGLSVNEQSNSNQATVLEIGATKQNVEVVQTIPVAKSAAQMQMGEKPSLANAAQGVTDGQNNVNPATMLKQVLADSMVNQQTGDMLKQDASSGEQNKSGIIPQQTDGMESSAVTTSELKLLHPEGTADNMITIKVGEPSLNSSWKQAAEEIGNMIVEKINHEVQKVNITLNPKDLGEIDVEFFINKGKISVALNCSNEATKTLLATNIDSLSKVVQSSLMQDVSVSLNHDKTDGQNTNSENFDGSGNNGHHQEDSQNKKKEQEQPNLDFVQRLRLGIDSIEGAEV